MIGRELSIQLARQGRRIRQVGRHPIVLQPGDELKTADLTNADAAFAAVAGSEVVYLVAGLTYSTSVWQARWPLVMRNVIDACSRHKARLVFLDNVYAYGRVANDGVMRETHHSIRAAKRARYVPPLPPPCWMPCGVARCRR